MSDEFRTEQDKQNEKIVKKLDAQIIIEDILASQSHYDAKDEFHIRYRRDLLKKIRDRKNDI